MLEFERGQVEEAVRCFHRAQELRPQTTEANYNLGKAMRTLGDRRGAQRYLELAYEAGRGDANLLEELGELYVETERLAAARALAEDGLRAGEESGCRRIAGAASVLRARVALCSGEFDEAAAELEALLVDQPDCHKAFSVLGEVRAQQGELERGSLAVRQALLIEPRNAEYHRQLGVTMSALGEARAARESFARARALQPGIRVPRHTPVEEPEQSAAWERLRLQASLLERARSYAEKGRWRAGIAEFLALTARYPGESVVWQELAWFYEKLSEPRRSLTLYRKAAELDPRNLEVALRVGRLELGMGRPDAALEVLSRMGVEVAEVPEVLELRGEVHRVRGEVAEARRLFEAALAGSPNRISALRGVGACLLGEGNPEAAVESWTQAFRAFPGDPDLALDLAGLLAQLERPGDAERVLRAAAERSPTHVGLLLRLARLLVDGRRFAAARKVYATMVQGCRPATLAEGVDLLEAQVFCRELKAARRLARSVARHRTRGGEGARIALLEALLAVLGRDANKFSPAWQRAWREDPELDRHGRYVAGLLDAADLEFLRQEVRRGGFLFAGDATLAAGLERFAAELSTGGALRSLPSG